MTFFRASDVRQNLQGFNHGSVKQNWKAVKVLQVSKTSAMLVFSRRRTQRIMCGRPRGDYCSALRRGTVLGLALSQSHFLNNYLQLFLLITYIVSLSHRSVLSLHLKKKGLSASDDLGRQPQLTSPTFTLRQTGPSPCRCQHQKRRRGSKPRQSRLMWFLLT